MFETLGFLDQFKAADPGPFEAARLSAIADQEREDQAAKDQAEARRAAAEERAEALALADRQLGGPLAEMSRARSDFAAASDEIGELQGRLAKAQHRQDRAQASLEFWAERMQLATDASMRSAPLPLDPVEAACMRPLIALDDQRREGRRVLEQARAQQRARRGVSVRSQRPFGDADPVPGHAGEWEAERALRATYSGGEGLSVRAVDDAIVSIR